MHARSARTPSFRAHRSGVFLGRPTARYASETQETATRPLAIQKNGTWYTYGWDLTKNICETYRTDVRITCAG